MGRRQRPDLRPARPLRVLGRDAPRRRRRRDRRRDAYARRVARGLPRHGGDVLRGHRRRADQQRPLLGRRHDALGRRRPLGPVASARSLRPPGRRRRPERRRRHRDSRLLLRGGRRGPSCSRAGQAHEWRLRVAHGMDGGRRRRREHDRARHGARHRARLDVVAPASQRGRRRRRLAPAPGRGHGRGRDLPALRLLPDGPGVRGDVQRRASSSATRPGRSCSTKTAVARMRTEPSTCARPSASGAGSSSTSSRRRRRRGSSSSTACPDRRAPASSTSTASSSSASIDTSTTRRASRPTPSGTSRSDRHRSTST
jgi:hypothetical protein